jgi:hypothetical protein
MDDRKSNGAQKLCRDACRFIQCDTNHPTPYLPLRSDRPMTGAFSGGEKQQSKQAFAPQERMNN